MASPKKKPAAPNVEQRQVLQPITLRAFVKGADQAVQQQKGNMAMKLARGSCASMEAYNREVGRIEGMEQAVGLLKDMLGQIEDAERNADLPEMQQ